MRSFKALATLLLAIWAVPAHAWAPTANGSANCTTAVNSCATTVTSTVSTGSGVLLVSTLSSISITSAPTVTDSAGNSYTVQYVTNSKGTLVVAWCASTTAALTGGTSTITVTSSSTTQYFATAAFTVSGFNTSIPFDKQGTDVAANMSNGTAISGPTSPALLYTSEYALVVVGVGAPPSTGTALSSVTGGYSLVANTGGPTAYRPEQWIYGQTLTTGTATFGATPTISATAGYNAQVFMFPTAGAVLAPKPLRTLLGVGQ